MNYELLKLTVAAKLNVLEFAIPNALEVADDILKVLIGLGIIKVTKVSDES